MIICKWYIVHLEYYNTYNTKDYYYYCDIV